MGQWFNWDLLLKLTRDIPDDLDRRKSKEEIPREISIKIKQRDKVCRLCGSSKDLVIHHIVTLRLALRKKEVVTTINYL